MLPQQHVLIEFYGRPKLQRVDIFIKDIFKGENWPKHRGLTTNNKT
jgi:hypothetical protein